MPTNSKKKVSRKSPKSERWAFVDFLKVKISEIRGRRPHRSFQLTRRRDYVRVLELPGYIRFTHEVNKTLWRHRTTFLLLALVYIALYAFFVGVTSQESYTSLTDTLQTEGEGLFSGWTGALEQAGLLFLTVASMGFGETVTESQQFFSALLFMFIWLTTVWLLRNLLAGHKVKLRDGLYNAGAPILAMIAVAAIIAVQLIPIFIAGVGYTAANTSGLLDGGVATMLFWVAFALLVILSLFWLIGSLFAMIVITLPGTYPVRAMKTANDLVFGRRLKIVLRWLWLSLVIFLGWATVLISFILIDTGIKSLWPAIEWLPIIPIVMLILSVGTVIWTSAYVYLLYRKVVDNA